MGMSFYFVNLSDFMGLVAKKMQENKRKSRIFNFLGKISWGENEKHMFRVLHVLPKKKKINYFFFYKEG